MSTRQHKSTLTVLTCIVCVILTHSAGASYDPNEVLDRIEAFLIRQMEVFDRPDEPNLPIVIQTYGWDPNLPFPEDLPAGRPAGLECRFDVYDLALAALFFINRSEIDPSILE